MLKLLFVLPSLMFLALLSQGPAGSPAPAAPPAAAVPENNPVKPTAESQAHAKETYKIDCAMCHGENGNGKGDLVGDMGLSLKDLRDPATLADKSDGDLYTLIHDGKGKMPAEGDRSKPDDVWNLVVLLRSMAKK